jgi:hypothetical protein
VVGSVALARSQQLQTLESPPDLVALRDSSRFAIEVELAGKSRPRLDSVLKLHDDWIRGGKIGGVIYICGNEEGQRRVERSAPRVAPFGRKLRLELAAKDPGPPYRALWHPATDAERDASWPPEEKVAMLHAVQKLEAAGPRLAHPRS